VDADNGAPRPKNAQVVEILIADGLHDRRLDFIH
jgi:hypothetical protein